MILSLETATRAGSLALMKGEKVIARKQGEGGRSHSTYLLADVDECLRLAGVQLENVDLFVAVTGPGSFTGLRTGLATVKAFAMMTEKMIAPVPTLHAIARMEGRRDETIVFSLLPAGRGELFAQMLAVESDDSIIEHSIAAHLAPEMTLEKALTVKKRLRWAGDAARDIKEQIREKAESAKLIFADEETCKEKIQNADWTLAAKPPAGETLAEHAAHLGLARFRAGQVVAPEELKAFYVRLSDAEIKEKCLR